MANVLATTDFKLPGQTSIYHGKVRDVYTINDKLMVSVATDRLSAFDVILPKQIPYKGQVLNQLAAHFLESVSDVVPNWLSAVPDPNVSVGVRAVPFQIELVVRGYLVGHAYREYQSGKRELCGIPLPEGMKEYEAFPAPIITPTTKAHAGHDEDISKEEILSSILATATEWETLEKYALDLFHKGQTLADDRGLVLADTKYEFGKIGDQIILIDEIHTPDSSRYFYKNSLQAYNIGESEEEPEQLSKEFVRQWLISEGFQGQSGQPIPEMSDDFVNQVSNRYIELYESVTGASFVKDTSDDIAKRIENNINLYFKEN